MAIDAIDDAVLNLLIGDATLMTLLPGNIYVDEAPENCETPFATLTLMGEVVTLEQGGTAFVTARYQITVHDRASTKTAAQAALERIDLLLDHTVYPITGFVQMTSHRVDRFPAGVRREGPLLWQDRGCVYEVWASPGLT